MKKSVKAMQADPVFVKAMESLLSRAAMAAAYGTTFDGARNVRQACGYPQEITIPELCQRYERDAVATRVVEAFPDACWATVPEVYETEKEGETDFEKKWMELADAVGVYSLLKRFDRLLGVGRFGVLFLGLNDVDAGSPEKEPVNATALAYGVPLKEDRVTVSVWEEDATSPRYGLPKIYSLNMSRTRGNNVAGATKTVHWKRVIHVAENIGEDDVYGRSRLSPVYDRLLDLEKIAGGSAEMFWRGGFPGLSFEAEPGVTLPDADKMKAHIEEYTHNLTRVLRLKGIKTNQLNPTIADPEAHVRIQFWFISAATGIPMRVLMGNEAGELASSQDQRAWNDRTLARCNTFCAPDIMIPFIKRLQDLGVLPETKELHVEWSPKGLEAPKERADISRVRVDTMKLYAESPELRAMFTPEQFLVRELDMTPDEAKKVIAEAEAALPEEEELAEPAAGSQEGPKNRLEEGETGKEEDGGMRA